MDFEAELACFVGIVNYLTKSQQSIAESMMLGFEAIEIHTARVLFLAVMLQLRLPAMDMAIACAVFHNGSNEAP